MAGLRISVHGSKELQSLILRLRNMDSDIASQINKATRSMAEPVWQERVAAHSTDRLQSRVLANTARVSVTRSNVTLKAGAIGKSLTGGATPSELVHAVEFGANREKYSRYLNRRKSKTFPTTRRSARQFRSRNLRGYVVYPAAADIIPRIASLWVQTVVRTFHEAIEGSIRG